MGKAGRKTRAQQQIISRAKATIQYSKSAANTRNTKKTTRKQGKQPQDGVKYIKYIKYIKYVLTGSFRLCVFICHILGENWWQ